MKIPFTQYIFSFSLMLTFINIVLTKPSKTFKERKNISTKKLTQMSDKCYYLFSSFIEKEKRLRLKMTKA
ncbi:MAG: hypothetical protein ACLS7B_01425 [Hominilimicola sp.]